MGLHLPHVWSMNCTFPQDQDSGHCCVIPLCTCEPAVRQYAHMHVYRFWAGSALVQQYIHINEYCNVAMGENAVENREWVTSISGECLGMNLCKYPKVSFVTAFHESTTMFFFFFLKKLLFLLLLCFPLLGQS